MPVISLKQIQAAIVAGLCAFVAGPAHAACGHADNFSYAYPAYSATWTPDQCEQYAADGIGGCYNFGGDAGWGGTVEGVDCSAYCARVWAIPGHIGEKTTGAHPYSTYSWYPNDGSIPTPPAHTHFVTVSSINDILPYDFFVLNANYGTLGIHHMGLIESVDYAGGVIYTREANCSDTPTSGCDGPSGIHDKAWTYNTLVVNGRARIVRRNDWGATTNRSVMGPIVMNANGALELFGIGSDTSIWHDKQAGPNSSWNGWSSITTSGAVPGCAVTRDLDGRIEVFVAANGSVMRKAQASAGGSWNAWASIGGNGFTNLQAMTNLDGRIELFAVGTNGDIWHTWESTANGSFVGSWYDRTGKQIKAGYTAAMNADGRLELFGVASDGHCWHNYQTNAGSGWKGWTSLGGTNLNADLCVGKDADGRLELFALGNGNSDIWVNFQTSPGGSYSGWYDIGGSGIKAGFVVGINATGRLEMFGVGSNSDVWHSFQVNAGGGWSAWQDMGQAGMDRRLLVGNNADGRLQVFGIGSNGHVMSNFQNDAGGTWFGWLDMGGAGTKFYQGQ